MTLAHGSQAQHVAERFAGYQVATQSANAYVDGSRPGFRDEEGVGVVSWHPVVHVDYALLSRDVSDKDDVHQRIIFHAVVAHPSVGLIDVYVTHGPLSAHARRRTTPEAFAFMERSRRGQLQLFLGDMNAEPQEDVPLFWSGAQPLASPPLPASGMLDAWLQVHPEPTPRSTDPFQQRHLLTFPCDNPAKRIDMIYYGAQPPAPLPQPPVLARLADTPADAPPTPEAVVDVRPDGSQNWGTLPPPPRLDWPHRLPPAPEPLAVRVRNATLCGQDPEPDTVPEGGYAGLGMVDPHSPLWASDHRGLVVFFDVSKY